MATIYKVEIVSHWVNYPPEELKRMLEEELLKKANFNELTVTVKRQ